jgi:hypothetical protein
MPGLDSDDEDGSLRIYAYFLGKILIDMPHS